MNNLFENFVAGAEQILDVRDTRFDEPVAEVDEHLGRLGLKHFINEAENAQVDALTGIHIMR